MQSLPPLSEYVKSERTRLIARLARQGFGDVTALPYEQYLNTALWTRIKAWVRIRDAYSCRLCLHQSSPHSLEELDVHHRSYDQATLEGLEGAQLISLCRRCHHRVEWFADGSRRRDLREKEVELHRMMALRQRIRDEGLLVRTVRARNRIDLRYCGDPAFQEFHDLTEFLVAFILEVERRHKDQVRLPLPFSTARLSQPSGVRLLERGTTRAWLTVRSTDKGGSIHVAMSNPLPVDELLAHAFTRERKHPFYWRQVSA